MCWKLIFRTDGWTEWVKKKPLDTSNQSLLFQRRCIIALLLDDN